MKTPSLRLRIAALLLAALAVPAVEAADAPVPADYPNRPIRIVAPTPPGSPPDVIARLIGDRLAAVLGQPVIVENKPGAVGTIGLQVVAKAPADGYTFGVLAMPFILGPSLLPSMPYDQQKDLAPVSHVVWASNILVVNSSSKVQSLPDLVKVGRTNRANSPMPPAAMARPRIWRPRCSRCVPACSRGMCRIGAPPKAWRLFLPGRST